MGARAFFYLMLNFGFHFSVFRGSVENSSFTPRRVLNDSTSSLSILTSLSSAVAFDSVSFLSSSISSKRFFFSASNLLSFSTVSRRVLRTVLLRCASWRHSAF